MIVHGGSPSPFARKVMVALEEKGLSYENKQLIPFPKTPELLAMNPLGKIPILELNDGTYIADSSVICAYLEKIQPDPALLPSDPIGYARGLFIEEYCDTKLNEAVGPIFFNRYVKPKIFQQEPDEAEVEQAFEEQLAPVLDQVEEMMPDKTGPLLEAGYSLADIAFGVQLGSLALASVELGQLCPLRANHVRGGANNDRRGRRLDCALCGSFEPPLRRVHRRFARPADLDLAPGRGSPLRGSSSSRGRVAAPSHSRTPETHGLLHGSTSRPTTAGSMQRALPKTERDDYR